MSPGPVVHGNLRLDQGGRLDLGLRSRGRHDRQGDLVTFLGLFLRAHRTKGERTTAGEDDGPDTWELVLHEGRGFSRPPAEGAIAHTGYDQLAKAIGS